MTTNHPESLTHTKKILSEMSQHDLIEQVESLMKALDKSEEKREALNDELAKLQDENQNLKRQINS